MMLKARDPAIFSLIWTAQISLADFAAQVNGLAFATLYEISNK
jgi:hypothetical protein